MEIFINRVQLDLLSFHGTIEVGAKDGQTVTITVVE